MLNFLRARPKRFPSTHFREDPLREEIFVLQYLTTIESLYFQDRKNGPMTGFMFHASLDFSWESPSRDRPSILCVLFTQVVIDADRWMGVDAFVFMT